MIDLETVRLRIRNFQVADWEALHTIIGQYQASEFAAYDHAWPNAPEEIRRITEWFAGGDSYLAVCLKDEGRCIGLVALNPEADASTRTFNLGYIFDFDFHGKGYATEACRAVLDYAFAHLDAQQVVTGTAAANGVSCRLLARLGFERIAESVTSFRNTQDGTPIQFIGYTFVLVHDQWQHEGEHESGESSQKRLGR